jgi:tetratricopeptide (TPR) repeat protein
MAYSNVGVNLEKLNRIKEAISFYDKAILINPKISLFHSNRLFAIKDLQE